jgi:hypothetical protein
MILSNLLLSFCQLVVSAISKKENQQMIELRSKEQLAKAIERAKAGKLFVQPSKLFRQYHVTNRETGAQYTVDFFVRKDNKRFGHCTCKGGMAGYACKHLCAAASYHLMRAAARFEEQRIASMQQAA